MKTLTRNRLDTYLDARKACGWSTRWVNNTPGTVEDLWNKCEVPSWFMFLMDGQEEFDAMDAILYGRRGAIALDAQRVYDEGYRGEEKAVRDYRARTGLRWFDGRPFQGLKETEAFDSTQAEIDRIRDQESKEIDRIGKVRCVAICNEFRALVPFKKVEAVVLDFLERGGW
jgi:hypothetical protein